MSLIFKDLVMETTTTTSTGTLTLAGAVTGYQSFAAIGDGNTCYYCIQAVDGSGVPSGDWEVGLGTYTASGTTLTRTTVLASSNSGAAVSLSAGTKRVFVVNPAAAFTQRNNVFGSGNTLVNGTLVESHSGNAATYAIKDANGNDPSVASPVYVAFRSATATSGTYSILTLTAATSITISSGSSVGSHGSSKAFRIWVVGFNDGGTFRLGVINAVTTPSGDTTEVYPVRNDILASSTAEGGAGGADVNGVYYTGTAVTSKAITVLGYMEYGSGLVTPGTWDASPTKIQLFGPGVSLPGEVIQRRIDRASTTTTGTTSVPADDTVPTSSEGTAFLSETITPTSAANVLVVTADLMLYAPSGNALAVSVHQDGSAAKKTVWNNTMGGMPYYIQYRNVARTTSATTFEIRAGTDTGSTVTFNGFNGARFYGGVVTSQILIEELQG